MNGARQATVRIRDAGDSALLLQLEAVIDPVVNARVLSIADAVRGRGIRGVRDVVPMYRSVAVHFDPLVAEVAAIRAALERAAESSRAAPESADAALRPAGGRIIDIPVEYGGEFGPDLEDVAAFAGMRPQQVIERHSAIPYRVFMLGFLPGFPYMGVVSTEIAMPRKVTPRVRVPRGSVGIAGAQTGIYPTESPGGWQIVGRTPVALFDPERTPAALFAPGDHVRFLPQPGAGRFGPESGPDNGKRWGPPSGGPKRTMTVLRPGLFTTIQDLGRWGYQADGVPVSGAMDRVSHRIANAIVGNESGAATIEATLMGPELRLEQDTTVAIAGADVSVTLDGAALAPYQPVRCRQGAVVRFGERRSGARAYIAFDGGIDVPAVLGSRATHVRSALGGSRGRALAAGDSIALGDARQSSVREIDRLLPAFTGGARLRVLTGPQDDFFPPDALELLERSRFTISSQSDRMGYRLQGPRIARQDDREMISDAAFEGGIQVPPSGEPILLMADRQTTGGYPQIATVITADLPLAAQLAPGDWIEFQPCTRTEAIAALAAQEGLLSAPG